MASAFTLGILISLGVMVAYAGAVYGNWGNYGPVNGYSYKNRAMAQVYNNYLGAGTDVSNQAYVSVPAGYMGAKARLYNSSNVLVDFSTMEYNSVSVISFGVLFQRNSYPRGYYYSKGITAAYNGNGYTQYTTLQSPNIYY